MQPKRPPARRNVRTLVTLDLPQAEAERKNDVNHPQKNPKRKAKNSKKSPEEQQKPLKTTIKPSTITRSSQKPSDKGPQRSQWNIALAGSRGRERQKRRIRKNTRCASKSFFFFFFFFRKKQRQQLFLLRMFLPIHFF